jgi:hypothetical protein
MYRPLAAVIEALNPGLAQTRQKLTRVRDDLRELHRSIERLDQARRGDADRLQDAVGALTTQLQETTRELRHVSDGLAALRLKESQLRAIARREGELEAHEGELADVLARPGTAAHVAAAIERAALHVNPFPYAVVDDLLPDALYDAVVAGIPPVELFADKPVNKQQLKVPFALAPAYSRRVWRFLAEVVVPEMITTPVVEKFRVPLTDWIRQNWPMLGEDPLADVAQLHSTDGRILLRTRGYTIPPHRDPKWGFLTCILYLARPGDAEAWGTQIYTVDPAGRSGAPITRQTAAAGAPPRGAAPDWIDPSECTLVDDVLFRRNRALIFLNSVGAHGACIPADAEPANLERYIYQFRIGPTGAAIRSMTEALPEDRRPLWAGKSGDY